MQCGLTDMSASEPFKANVDGSTQKGMMNTTIMTCRGRVEG